MNQQEAIKALYLEGKTIRDKTHGNRTYRFDPTSGNVVNELGQTTSVSFSPNAQWTTVEAEPLRVGDTVTDVDDREAKIVFVDDEISLAREVSGARTHWIIYNELWLAKETVWSRKGPEWLRLGDKLVSKQSGAKATVTNVNDDEAVITTTNGVWAIIKKWNWVGGGGESFNWRREPAAQQMKEQAQPRGRDSAPPMSVRLGEAEVW